MMLALAHYTIFTIGVVVGAVVIGVAAALIATCEKR